MHLCRNNTAVRCVAIGHVTLALYPSFSTYLFANVKSRPVVVLVSIIVITFFSTIEWAGSFAREIACVDVFFAVVLSI
jgi:hypothetical protein